MRGRGYSQSNNQLYSPIKVARKQTRICIGTRTGMTMDTGMMGMV